jgi:hypothetical protein
VIRYNADVPYHDLISFFDKVGEGTRCGVFTALDVYNKISRSTGEEKEKIYVDLVCVVVGRGVLVHVPRSDLGNITATKI